MSRIRHEKIGDVFIREFDEGVIKTLGATLVGNDYYLPLSFVPGVDPPLFTEWAEQIGDIGQPMPGIPVIFYNPEGSFQRYVLPCVLVKREDPSPALERWGSLQDKYRAPAPGATSMTVQYGSREKNGYDQYESQQSAWPYDIPYTISVEASGKRARTNAQVLLKHCMSVFGPYGVLTVTDQDGRERKYNVFGEGPSDLSVIGDLRDRLIIYALSLRVAAELDVALPMTHKAMTSVPDIRVEKKEVVNEDL